MNRMTISESVTRLGALVLLAFAAFGFAANRAQAQTESVLFDLSAATGFSPSTLIPDGNGNFFGTNVEGGQSGLYGYGTVFELSPNGAGGWNYTNLYQFQGGADGWEPNNLVLGPNGTIFGVTYVGGSSNRGILFELTPNGNGTWTKTTIHDFAGDADGAYPNSIVADGQGNFYGTAATGFIPQSYGGTFYEISPAQGGGYSFQVLYTFQDSFRGGPMQILRTASGEFFGVTQNTVAYLLPYPGVAFQLTNSGGSWKEKILGIFMNDSPASLAMDSAGDIFVATFGAKKCMFCGDVYELTPSGSGYTTSHIATISGGANPVTVDASGNLYGTSYEGGKYGRGFLYKLTNSGGVWTETTLYTFTGKADGGDPSSNLVLDTAGNLYGGLYTGGTSLGAFFELTP